MFTISTQISAADMKVIDYEEIDFQKSFDEPVWDFCNKPTKETKLILRKNLLTFRLKLKGKKPKDFYTSNYSLIEAKTGNVLISTDVYDSESINGCYFAQMDYERLVAFGKAWIAKN